MRPAGVLRRIEFGGEGMAAKTPLPSWDTRWQPSGVQAGGACALCIAVVGLAPRILARRQRSLRGSWGCDTIRFIKE